MSELRQVEKSDLRLGVTLPGHICDCDGRVLITAGTVVKGNHLQGLAEYQKTGLYKGEGWPQKSATETETHTPSEVLDEIAMMRSEPARIGWIVPRRHERKEWKVALDIELEESCGVHLTRRQLRVTSNDISVGGYSFIYHQFIYPGTIVRTCVESLPTKPTLTGIIRSCIAVEGEGHRVGVEFQSDL